MFTNRKVKLLLRVSDYSGDSMQEDFATKKKMLFESLETAEKSLQGSTLEQKEGNYNYNLYRNLDRNQQRKRGREEYVEKYKNRGSLFKRPNLPINKCLKSRQKPAYEVRTKYCFLRQQT